MNSAWYLSTLSSALYLAAALAPAFGKEGVLPNQRTEAIGSDSAALTDRQRKCDALAITGVADEVTDRASERAFSAFGCSGLIEDAAKLRTK